MSVIYANDFDPSGLFKSDDPLVQEHDRAVLERTRRDVANTSCFLCNELLSFPIVFWSGATSQIYLHEVCAHKFVLALARDCHGLERNRRHGHIDENGNLIMRTD